MEQYWDGLQEVIAQCSYVRTLQHCKPPTRFGVKSTRRVIQIHGSYMFPMPRKPKLKTQKITEKDERQLSKQIKQRNNETAHFIESRKNREKL